MSDVFGVGLIGGLFVLLGIWCISRKRFVLEFGRQGWISPKPAIIFTLTEGRATLFGCISLFVGLAMIGLSIYATRDEATVRHQLLVITTVAGASIVVLIWLLEVCIEFLVTLKNKSK